MRASVVLREGPETVAAFIADPVQAARGVLIPPPGYFARVQIMESQGVHLPLAEVSPESFAAHWDKIADMSGARPFDSAGAALAGAFLP